MRKPLDVTRPVVTVSGLEARIIASDRVGHGGAQPIIALVKHPDGTEFIHSYSAFGVSRDSRGFNLINIPNNTRKFGNIYGTNCHALADEFTPRTRSDRDALGACYSGTIAVVFDEDGKLLSSTVVHSA